MSEAGYKPYEPQLEPVKRAEDVWTVEGPEIAYRLGGVSLPCPTRMTVVKLSNGSLWLHSPVTYTTGLEQSLAALGPIASLIAPNSYHHSHIRAWATTHPEATVFASPDVLRTIGSANCEPLGFASFHGWSGDIEQTFIDLGSFKEAVFFHRASGTMIVTDLMQTFEASRVNSFLTKMLLKAGGATGPNPRPSIEIRLAARGHRSSLRAGVKQMLAWNPKLIILSHGQCIAANGVAEIERAFAWAG